MSVLTQIKAAADIPAADLGDQFPANEPQGEPVAMIRSKDFRDGPSAGVWECTPGRWKRAVKNEEFAHFVKGRCRFHHENGEVIDIAAGDAVHFPANTRGTWEVIETVRKTYFLVPLA
ncbi:cupin domain-containing protein [soil metagenome]